LTISEVVLQISQKSLALTITDEVYTKYKKLVEMMNYCMKYNAKERPTFEELEQTFSEWKESDDPKQEH